MSQSDAAFDRALGAWEARQLNGHLAGEEAAEDAYDKAEGVVWDLKLSELYEMTPVGVSEKVEEVAEAMIEHVADLLLEGRWE